MLLALNFKDADENDERLKKINEEIEKELEAYIEAEENKKGNEDKK